MALPTLAELVRIPTQDEALDQDVLPELTSSGVRVTDWVIGGLYRSMAKVVSRLWVLARTIVAAVAAGGFEDWAFGFSQPPGGIDVTGWAPLIAKQRYGVDRIEASFTRRTITLTNSTATPYGPLQPGRIILAFPSGNRYVLDETITIPASGAVAATFRSEFASDSTSGLSYNDPSGSTIAFVTASYPGVTATNPAPSYTPVAQAGSGVGTVTPSGTPSGTHSVAVRIDASGTIAGTTAHWSTRLDGGSWVSRGTASSASLGSGITVTLADAGGAPAFLQETYYFFQTPGSDVVAVGRDVETPQELGARCRGLWPSLAFAKDSAGNWIPTSPTISAYEALARSASDQVKVVLVETDGEINNQVNLVVAGQGAPLPTSVLQTLALFFKAFRMITDLPVVSTSTQRAITLAGATITCTSSQLAAAQAALTSSLQRYLGGVDPRKALSVNGRIDHAYIVGIIINTPGVTKFTDSSLTINGVVGDLQLPVTPGAYEQASWTQTITTAFTWVTE